MEFNVQPLFKKATGLIILADSEHAYLDAGSRATQEAVVEDARTKTNVVYATSRASRMILIALSRFAVGVLQRHLDALLRVNTQRLDVA